MRKLIPYFIALFVLLVAVPCVFADQTQLYSKIFLAPYYREATMGGTAYNYTLRVNPPDGLTQVYSATITFEAYFTPSVNVTLKVNNQTCNTPSFYISTTYTGAAQQTASFDCSNVINKSGNYTVEFKATKNTGAINGWLDLTFSNGITASASVKGTEYQVGDSGKIFAQFLINLTTPINNGSCFADVYYPDNTLLYNQAAMTATGTNGLYYLNLVAPNTTGIYMVSVKCSVPLLLQNATLISVPSTEFPNISPICQGNNFTDNWNLIGQRVYDDETALGLLPALNNFVLIAGGTSTSFWTTTSYMFQAQATTPFTQIDWGMNSQLGAPENLSWISNISICPTNVTNLTSNASYGADCTGTITTLNSYVDLGCYLNHVNYIGERKNIPLNVIYNLTNGSKYIIFVNHISHLNYTGNNFWTTRSSNYNLIHYRRVDNASTVQIYNQLPEMHLYNTGASIINSTDCHSNSSCLKIYSSAEAQRSFDATNDNMVNITFWSKTYDLGQNDKAQVLYYDGTWHVIKEWGVGESHNWTQDSIAIYGYNFGINKISFKLISNTSTAFLLIDDLQIYQNKVSYYYDNATTYLEARGGSELHITDYVAPMNSLLNQILTYLSSTIYPYLQTIFNKLLGIETQLNTTINITNQTLAFASETNQTTHGIKNDTSTIINQITNLNISTQAGFAEKDAHIQSAYDNLSSQISSFRTNTTSNFNLTWNLLNIMDINHNLTTAQMLSYLANLTLSISNTQTQLANVNQSIISTINSINTSLSNQITNTANTTQTLITNLNISSQARFDQLQSYLDNLTAQVSNNQNITQANLTALQNMMLSVNLSLTTDITNLNTSLYTVRSDLLTQINQSYQYLIAMNQTINNNLFLINSSLSSAIQTFRSEVQANFSTMFVTLNGISGDINGTKAELLSGINNLSSQLEATNLSIQLKLDALNISMQSGFAEKDAHIQSAYNNITSQINNLSLTWSGNFSQILNRLDTLSVQIDSNQNITQNNLSAINNYLSNLNMSVQQGFTDLNSSITTAQNTIISQINLINQSISAQIADLNTSLWTKMDEAQNRTEYAILLIQNISLNINTSNQDVLDYLSNLNTSISTQFGDIQQNFTFTNSLISNISPSNLTPLLDAVNELNVSIANFSTRVDTYVVWLNGTLIEMKSEISNIENMTLIINQSVQNINTSVTYLLTYFNVSTVNLTLYVTAPLRCLEGTNWIVWAQVRDRFGVVLSPLDAVGCNMTTVLWGTEAMTYRYVNQSWRYSHLCDPATQTFNWSVGCDYI